MNTKKYKTKNVSTFPISEVSWTFHSIFFFFWSNFMIEGARSLPPTTHFPELELSRGDGHWESRNTRFPGSLSEEESEFRVLLQGGISERKIVKASAGWQVMRGEKGSLDERKARQREKERTTRSAVINFVH